MFSFHRFAENIEAIFTKIFLINLNLNMICGSAAGVQVYINFSFFSFTNNFEIFIIHILTTKNYQRKIISSIHLHNQDKFDQYNNKKKRKINEER